MARYDRMIRNITDNPNNQSNKTHKTNKTYKANKTYKISMANTADNRPDNLELPKRKNQKAAEGVEERKQKKRESKRTP